MAQLTSDESACANDSHSLTSSVTDYPIENGRQYHRYHEGSYIYPNDEREMDRQDMQYHMLKLVNNGQIFFAPLDNPKQILDIGTGTGIWPVEMAALFPDSQITGTDLSPVQPTDVPENVHFLIDYAMESDWLWPENHFDYIHTSMLLGSFESFEDLLKTAFKYLKPGGYIECHDYDIDLQCDDDTLPIPDANGHSSYGLHNWIRLHSIATSQMIKPPRPMNTAPKITGWMRAAGFADVQERVSKVPLTPWSRDKRLRKIGHWNQQNWLDGLSAFSYISFGPRGLGWSQDAIEVFLVEVRESLRDLSVHAYNNFHAVVARKPE
ncbi:hypothetical protein AJ80_08482 [Polytolypa hystricis UAMH7299]|uniref:Methyltransferase domain-containing protein n=1 Tax=Polytolypa hystricis (strain UAMH7299) TaxID=1447883 RepID=A0A2B7X7L4_POLH7|nr:hypothetical protein AJ80_08482 [Polytolypa hystricis UAMH7299]